MAIYPRSLVAKGEEIGKKTGDFSGQFSYWILTRVRSLTYRARRRLRGSHVEGKKSKERGRGKRRAGSMVLAAQRLCRSCSSAGRSVVPIFFSFLFSVLFFCGFKTIPK